ncbi:MAG: hypothetical protein ACFFCS_01000 [Candidatus Hodarchaeota archaeon]
MKSRGKREKREARQSRHLFSGDFHAGLNTRTFTTSSVYERNHRPPGCRNNPMMDITFPEGLAIEPFSGNDPDWLVFHQPVGFPTSFHHEKRSLPHAKGIINHLAAETTR